MKFYAIIVFQFEDPRDADDAIRGRDGYNFDGHRLRVCCVPYNLLPSKLCHSGIFCHCFS